MGFGRDSGDRDRGNRFSSRGGGGSGGSFQPRQMYKAKCSECGTDCEVPFKPTEGKPVYCRECYNKRRDQ